MGLPLDGQIEKRCAKHIIFPFMKGESLGLAHF